MRGAPGDFSKMINLALLDFNSNSFTTGATGLGNLKALKT